LLEYETLNGEEVGSLMRGETIVRPDPDDPSTDAGRKKRSSVPSSGHSKEPGKDSGDEPPGGMEPEPQPGS